jgi:cytochrome c2
MKMNRILTILILLVALSNKTFADPIETGKSVFISRCAACHNINKQLTGPALSGVDQRRSTDWIISFVRSSQTMVKNGDKDAVAVFEKFNKIPMPDHQDLSEDEIKNIIEYIKSESKPLEENKPPFAKPGKKPDNARPLTLHDYHIFGIYFMVVITLIMVLLFAVHVNGLKRETSSDAKPL